MKLRFVAKQREVGDIYSFTFAPEQSLTWQAGQSIRLEIAGLERRFSIVNAPYEKNIAIATRLSGSDFKTALAALTPGDSIDGFNIEGTFVWQAAPQPHLLLASGVGITPYIAMFKQLAHDHQPLNAKLLYANRDEQFLFGQELKQLEREHPELKIEFLAGQRLSRQIIDEHTAELRHGLVYVSGPEAMVNGVTELLLDAGITPERLKQDIFTGRVGWEAR